MTLETQERILKIKKARLKLAERIANVEKCQNLTGASVGEGTSTYCGNCGYYDAFKDMLAEEKRIYAGTADFVEFFETVISTLGLTDFINYEVEDVDGELEIVIGGNV